MKRTLVIGDIHGGLKGLMQLQKSVQFTSEDQLIFLGDYVDGWSDSAQTINYLIELENHFECVFIKGNHDVWCLDWLRTQDVHEVWYKSGGKSTIESYKHVEDSVKEQHIDFFERLINYHVDSQNNLFIHAGFSSMYGPEKEANPSTYCWDRTLWEMAIATDSRIPKDSLLYPKRLLCFNEIYIGHTPTLNYKIDVPMNACNVWNIDTGAAFTGKLSCLDVDTKQFWQSETLQNHYPNETGRN
ncbi:serine/threonine protein phosphatase [Pedobacter yonginense]|uniref:Serine/threonine protein phosphatase n=1 Tax=Pedobacter yonginense TaxID=651869 RepID=A0A317ERJ2_9SPHI|nr:metallophosphoesterase family protein [Pedobacter yonginense]PWS29530.1 serine/threonine protein phosphatase [Pedobacter yonginense]